MRRALRGAVEDFYYNSWRFLGANLVVGTLIVVILLGTMGSVVTLVLLPLVAVPIAGIMRMATRLVRDGHTDFGDFMEVIRHPAHALVLGTMQSLVVLVLVIDLLVASAWGSWLGTFFLVSALYGFVLLWAYAAVAWPLVLDPERDGEPLRARLRLAAMVLLAHPIRMLTFVAVLGILLLIAGILIAPLLTFAIGLLWLAIARYVLPVADRVEQRPTELVEVEEA
jgi:hypothetical protein